jgi:PKD repeat protein
MKKISLLMFAVLLTVFNACKKDDVESVPETETAIVDLPIIACFKYSPTFALNTTTEIVFSNCTENATSHLWVFGDGATSAFENPKHTFITAGTYTVLLVSANQTNVDSVMHTVEVMDQVIADAEACFSYSPTKNITTEMEILFESCSDNISTYTWHFGDGNNSIAINPKHTYANGGTYNVTLIATNVSSVDSVTQTIVVKDPVSLHRWKNLDTWQDRCKDDTEIINGIEYLTFNTDFTGIKEIELYGNTYDCTNDSDDFIWYKKNGEYFMGEIDKPAADDAFTFTGGSIISGGDTYVKE